MERRRTKKTSEVDKVLRRLLVGETAPVTGSVSYWRNRQARYHKENPNAWIMVSKEDSGFIVERIK